MRLERRSGKNATRTPGQSSWHRTIPDDLVLATIEPRSMGNFLDAAFAHHDLDPHVHMKFDQHRVCPTDVDLLVGGQAKANAGQPRLRAKPRMKTLAQLMILAGLDAFLGQPDAEPRL